MTKEQNFSLQSALKTSPHLPTSKRAAPIMQKSEPLLYDELLHRQELYPIDWTRQTSPIDDLHDKAVKGDLESICQLSEHYRFGDEVFEDKYLAFRLLRFAAYQGHQPAYSALGKCYAFGIGTPQNPEEAVHWFLQTDYHDDVDILATLACCYHEGIGVAKDESKAYDLWIDAAEKGHSDGVRFCQRAADAGHARGQFWLGHFYQMGIDVPANIQTALRLFHQAAAQNYAPAQRRLGILYSDGDFDIEKDPVVAVQWFRLAAAQNDSVAQNWLAYCLANGEGTEQNIDEALRIWKTLARKSPDFPKGEPVSQYCLGTWMTRNGHVGYNPQEGVRWLHKSAQQNYKLAQTMLGTLYYEGFEDIFKQDFNKARFWFRKAALQGDSMAQYYLGEIYDNGSGVRENHKTAFKWYKQSSDCGYIPAMQKAAHCYLDGIGTRQNDEEGYMLLTTLALYGDEESRTLLQSAAKSGNSFAEYGLGFYSHKQNDIETAYYWFEKSTDKGNALAFHALAILHGNDGDEEQKLRYLHLATGKGDAEAQILLGLALENVPDKKAPQNEEAFKWMKAAADQGHPAANYYLGNFYRDGTWVNEDYQKAFECYSKAAEQGNSDGLDRLGECYAFGTGVMIDESLAFQYFRDAAARDNPKGQCNLGLCYLKGMGCHQDTELAFQWISRAIDSNNPIVIQMLLSVGLDVGKLSGGYRQIQSAMMGDYFGDENSNRLFGNPSKILPIPPSEQGTEE